MTRVTSRLMVALAAAGFLVPAWAQAPPSPARIAELSEQWADPVTDAPPGTSYHLFETASRGKGSKGSYLVYLPPSYETETARRYPVIYWLHGGFGNARQGAWAVEHLDRGIRAGLVPEAIVVLPQALPVGWYVNSKDGKRPIEDVIIKDLIPHVDATYRTIDRRESRGIEGMSMGGYGALHLGMKYPALFGAISSVAPAILPDLKDEPRERTFDTFGDDEAYYDANGPWALARANATALRQGCAIRLLAGDEDARLRSAITGFHELLTELGIPHQSSEVSGAGHVYEDIVGGLGDEGFAFWRQAFGPRPAPSLVDPYVARPRVVVMTDIANEPDDQMSLVRFLLYSNEWDVEGLVATTSTWMKARVRPDVILSVLDAYEKVQPNLLKHAPGFPAAAALRAVVASGQPAYGMAAVGEGKTSPGAELILRAAEKADPRPLWVLAWGGTNTLAQALVSARSTRSPAQVEALVSRLRIYAISDQDDAGPWIRREFPGLRYVATPSTQNGEEYYFATWTGISGDRFYRNAPGADFTTFTDEWVNANVRSKGPLGALYPFPCCIHEGDTPAFLGLVDNGLASAMSPAYGGWGGRYVWRQPHGETRPFWTQGGDSYPGNDSSRDTVTGLDGKSYTSDQATIWRWRAAFQHDFAARMDWTIKTVGEANHNPTVVVNGRQGTEPLVLDAQVGTPVILDAAGTTDPDGNTLKYSWFFYPEAGTGIPGQPVRQREPRSGRRRGGPGGAACRHAPRAAAARRRRERERPAREGHPEGRRGRPRDPGRRGRREAEPDVVPARHPEDEAGGGDGAYSTVNATERLAIAFALWSVTVTRSS